MNYSLVMAIIWFLIGAGWLAADWMTGGKLDQLPWGRRFPLGWVALLLCLYNVVRWRLRPRRRSRDSSQESLDPRRQMHRDDERALGPPDPNFNFTDPQPPVSSPRDPGPPPSGDGPPPAG